MNLQPDGVYIVDGVHEVYVWCGPWGNSSDATQAMKVAVEYVEKVFIFCFYFFFNFFFFFFFFFFLIFWLFFCLFFLVFEFFFIGDFVYLLLFGIDLIIMSYCS